MTAKICLTKAELYTLCEVRDREAQMRQLHAWGILFELTATGSIKVLRKDLVWSADNNQRKDEPNYDAA